MVRYEQVGNFIQFIQETFNVNVCIKEYSNFISIDRRLSEVLEPYKGHYTLYCKYVKQQIGHHRCLEMMRPMYDRCVKEQKGYAGVCHAGVYELVVPILLNEELLGSINVSYYRGDREISRRLRERCFRNASASAQKRAASLFSKSIRFANDKVSGLESQITMLADFLAANYGRLQLSMAQSPIPSASIKTNKEIILNAAMKYIKLNFASQLTVGMIAQAAGCSESYISRLFSRQLRVNVKTYVNRIRIEHSKKQLAATLDKISLIALDSGFTNPNYYSKVFSDLLGISPSEYRRRYTF